jgi:transcription initiation factor TFIIA small subunit
MAAHQERYYEMYRRSLLGVTLCDTLDNLIRDQKITAQVALKVLTHYDRIVANVLAEKAKVRVEFKGDLETYRFCDEVWTMIAKNVVIKPSNPADGPWIRAPRLKVVTQPSEKAKALEKGKGKKGHTVDRG